jgi:hypothetical protein
MELPARQGQKDQKEVTGENVPCYLAFQKENEQQQQQNRPGKRNQEGALEHLVVSILTSQR